MATKTPQDHLTAKTEVKKNDITVEFGGIEYVITADVIDNIEIMESIEDQKYIHAVRSIIGKQQWTAFKESNRTDGRVTIEVFEQFLDKVLGALGN